MENALQGADAVFIATEWPEFRSLQAAELVQWMDTPVVLDPGRFLQAQLGMDPRIRYLTVGKAV
jgi:UDP-glucose 6-dehydrogenase